VLFLPKGGATLPQGELPLNQDTAFAIAFTILFSLGVGIMFVKTVFEMLAMLWADSKNSHSPESALKKTERPVHHS
jgi:NhaP-type Na+/H+ or K+/H+ antiporter